MKWLSNSNRKPVLILSSAVMAFGVLAGCGSKDSANPAPDAGDKGANTKTAPFSLSIMAKSFTNDNASPESKVWKKIEEVTNTQLKVEFTPDANYNDKLNITMASGSLPNVVFIPSNIIRIPTVSNAIKGGVFWEIGPYLKDYPNLKQYNPTTLNNTSYDGKIYGLPAVRPLGRYGTSYRSDWLANVGLSEPTTVDEFYNMLKAFTNNDPDKNGKNDTYGMVVTKYAGPWDIMQTWFGVPNKWGADKDGKLVPAHMTPQYMDALKFFKKLYDEKLINQDFAVYDSAKWNDPIINSKAGVAIDVVDRSYQIEENMKKVNQNGTIGLIGSTKGLPLPSTQGHAGVFLISKSGVKTESDLKKVLNFFDKINDKDIQIMLNYGLEGTHYKVEDGKLITMLKPEDPQAPDINNKNLNQLSVGVPNVLDTAFKPGSPIRAKAAEVKAANEKNMVPNPAEPLTSAAYTQKGAQLDQIIADARVKFIVGKIDEAGFKAEVDKWKSTGGDDFIKEINEAYTVAQKK
ncbi:extracellular solute-binding protein [Paenibacillus alginolyticus]|uniref:extracellular solute-binding protein n=1 Tax=Paenibacillus alginolyticus TaxID=59839 RepID=UPI00040ACE2D|nr:extracellular solute-binding protein [Paenibacillus alginolyticus]MCY9668117.1 extracellular solute-binding protein [Paenibacillus alginolyticus]